MTPRKARKSFTTFGIFFVSLLLITALIYFPAPNTASLEDIKKELK